ncbi:DUF2066 domain-containing protein [Dongshaea marina]|uniref:DUF2066 domain-containing protein n=1 Tax=Dongshaea marina TaxID=2047966 RepID=UPI00131F0106|nr:DUF2066 domain-containing protein [Dongshaea marina]
MRYSWLLLCTLSLLLTSAAQAVEVSKLYTVQTDESGLTQQQAKQQAFSQMLLRLSGNPDVLKSQVVNQAKRNVDDYLLGFGRRNEQGSSFLVTHFDGHLMRQLVAEAGYPVLGELRPRTAIWIAQRGPQGQQTIISDQSTDDWPQQITSQAGALALPVILPLLDLEDLQQVKFSDVWGMFIEPVAQASQRYRADNIVMGRLQSLGSGVWQLNWELYSRSDQQFIQVSQGTLGDSSSSGLMHQLMLQLAGYYAKDFGAQTSTDLDTLDISVDGLTTMEQLIQAERLLKGLPTVASVGVVQLSGDKVLFHLGLSGSKPELIQALALDRRFSEEPFAGKNLSYQWQP